MKKHQHETVKYSKNMRQLVYLLAVCLFFILLLWFSQFVWWFFGVLSAAMVTVGYLFLRYQKQSQTLIPSIGVVLLTVVCSIFIKQFGYEVFLVPSESMQSELHPGDYIIVNKLTLQRSSSLTSLALNKKENPIRGIKPETVIVFHSPDGFINRYQVKRCVAIGGDTLTFENEAIQRNGRRLPSPDVVRIPYDVYYNDYEKIYHYIVKELDQKEAISEMQLGDFFTLNLNENEKESLKAQPFVTVVKPKVPAPIGKFNPNKKQIIIPHAGMTISLNSSTLELYGELLEQHENHSISEQEKLELISGKKHKTHTFKQNYFFMMGDNRNNSLDSRYYGMIPESSLVGEVLAVAFSLQHDSWKWNRILKSVN